MFRMLLCLVGNVVSPLLDGLNKVLNNGSLGNLSDWGKGIGGSLGETKTGGWDGGSGSRDGVGNMGRASGIVSRESNSRLGDRDLSRGWEGGSIGSRDSRGSRGSSNGSSSISSYRGPM